VDLCPRDALFAPGARRRRARVRSHGGMLSRASGIRCVIAAWNFCP